MSKNTKIWIIIAIFLILIGSITFCFVMNKFKWDFSRLSTVVFETNEYEIIDNFEDINIITNTANIEFILSTQSNTLIDCYEQKNINHLVKIEDDTLIIEVNDTRKWYEHIGIFTKTPKITIYLPKKEYDELMVKTSTGDVKIPNDFKFSNMGVLVSTGNIINNASVYDSIKLRTSTGDILVEKIIASMIELSTSTGKIDLINVNASSDIKINVSTGNTNIVDTNCNNIISDGSTGNISLDNVNVIEKILVERSTGNVVFKDSIANKISVETDTGNVKFKDSDAHDIFIETDTGDIVGNLLTDKVFFVETDTGKIDVPKTVANEKCEIITDTGDVKITVD